MNRRIAAAALTLALAGTLAATPAHAAVAKTKDVYAYGYVVGGMVARVGYWDYGTQEKPYQVQVILTEGMREVDDFTLKCDGVTHVLSRDNVAHATVVGFGNGVRQGSHTCTVWGKLVSAGGAWERVTGTASFGAGG